MVGRRRGRGDWPSGQLRHRCQEGRALLLPLQRASRGKVVAWRHSRRGARGAQRWRSTRRAPEAAAGAAARCEACRKESLLPCHGGEPPCHASRTHTPDQREACTAAYKGPEHAGLDDHPPSHWRPRAATLASLGPPLRCRFAGARLWDDGVIDPADTRRVVGLSLAAAMHGWQQQRAAPGPHLSPAGLPGLGLSAGGGFGVFRM